MSNNAWPRNFNEAINPPARAVKVTMNGQPFASFDTWSEAEAYVAMQRDKKGSKGPAYAATEQCKWQISLATPDHPSTLARPGR